MGEEQPPPNQKSLADPLGGRTRPGQKSPGFMSLLTGMVVVGGRP